MKRFFANLKLSWKVLIAPIAVLIFLMLLGLVSYWSLSNQKSAIEEIYGTRFKSFQSSARAIKDLTSVHANLYKMIGWANVNHDPQQIDALGKEQLRIVEEAMATLEKTAKVEGLSREEAAARNAVLVLLVPYKKTAFAAIDLATSDATIATMFMGKAEGEFIRLYKELNNLLAVETRLAQAAYDDSIANYNASLKTFLLVLLIAVVVSIMLSLLVAREITTPVHRAVEVIRQIAEGDLTQQIGITSNDEIGTLAQSVNEMREKMHTAVSESAATSLHLAEAASEQAATLEETSASLAEVSAMTRSNADNTATADGLVNSVVDAVEKAGASMSQLTLSMKEIADMTDKTQKIVKTIDEISFQTNLLALNAAVEAARAGEAGAGFAVVAGEVRNLALRAAEAARNTSNLISDVVVLTRAGERLVNTANQDFSAMKASSGKVGGLMRKIATASREQATGIEQINTAIQEMNRVTQQTAASAEDLAAAMATFVTEESHPSHTHRTHGGRLT
ncbi:MAG: methyl-accepting chemotaxis protein [Deltaproteobacteria bacterium]